MSKTNKIKANWARFHGHMADLPRKLRELADVMNRHYKGYRLGDDRKAYSKMKLQQRRVDRAKAQAHFRKEINTINKD